MKKLFYTIGLLFVLGMAGCSSNDSVVEIREAELPGDEQNIGPTGNEVGNLKNVDGVISYNAGRKLWYIRQTLPAENNDVEQEFYPLHIGSKFQRTPRKVVFSGEAIEMDQSYASSENKKCYAIRLTAINYKDSIYELGGHPGDTVSVHGMKIPFRPWDSDSLPVWMRPYLDVPVLFYVLKGTNGGNAVYNIWSYGSSNEYGDFYDANGNYLNINGAYYFSLVHDWECIYYKMFVIHSIDDGIVASDNADLQGKWELEECNDGLEGVKQYKRGEPFVYMSTDGTFLLSNSTGKVLASFGKNGIYLYSYELLPERKVIVNGNSFDYNFTVNCI